MFRVVKIKFGSHLYGTVTPESDLDWRSVMIPSGRDIVLQRVKDSFHLGPLKLDREKNKPGDIDETAYSLQKYLTMAASGETGALDMLFAPPESIDLNSYIWKDIQANSHRLVTKQAAAFVGYCRQQANKYGIKGSRIAAVREGLDMMNELCEKYGTGTRLHEVRDWIAAFVFGREHTQIIQIKQISGDMLDHLDICNRKFPYTITVKYAADILKKLLDEYGARALLAEKNEGIDWKALSHAVRVGYEALELLESGRITFPLQKAHKIILIKTGKLDYQTVSELIENLLEDVEQAAKKSSLPDQPDLHWVDDFVEKNYKKAIL